jgi:hypothetical protein
MTLANPVDAWDLWLESEAQHIGVTDILVRLRRPVLGIWNTETREVYIGEGMMEVHVEAVVAVGAGELEIAEYFVVNSDDLFGELRDAGGVSFPSLVAGYGASSMEANLDYDQLTDGPPTAAIGLPATTAASTKLGLPISSVVDLSSDPDNDIKSVFWSVDGKPRANDFVIPIGPHTLILEVEDERGAYDFDEQVVNVAPMSDCGLD